MIDQILLAVPVLFITGLVQFLKESGMPSKYAQLAALFFSLVFGVLALWNASLTEHLVAILEYALGSIGLWEVSKPIYNNLTGVVTPDENISK